jgi:hypothetical protein
MLLKLSHHVVK